MTEKSALQIAVALAGLVPVAAGIAGAINPSLLDLSGTSSAITHAAYLSGLLLGIGLSFWSLIPGIERQSRAFALLTGLVVIGGLARLISAIRLDVWSLSVLLPLCMELAVTPALLLWQRRLASQRP